MSPTKRSQAELDARAEALQVLVQAGVPHVVAGAYALGAYTGIFRDTKDLDVFLRETDLESAFRALELVGFRTELTDAGWIGKAFRGEWFVDLIFSSGNGIAQVDEAWFANARPDEVMGVKVLLAPPEEIIWSKSFVLERERYDGADVNHLLRACADRMDWDRLLTRFERYPEVLLSHLLLFAFVYPADRHRVPSWVAERLWEWARAGQPRTPGRLCRGPLLSREQYRHDLEFHGYEDGRRWDELDRGRETTMRADDDFRWDLPAGGGR